MKKIAIFVTYIKEDQHYFYSELLQKLTNAGFDISIHEKLETFAGNLNIKDLKTYSMRSEIENSDLILSCGGDGTLLRAANYIGRLNIPVVGINIGRLGFLSCVAIQEIDHLISNIRNKEYSVEERIMIELDAKDTIFKDDNFGLNEIAIHKKNSVSFLTIHAFINGHLLSTFWADGLIIATPTGSTAYSLSVGGPIITPDSNVFVITPIAPHTLSVRPIIVPDNSIIDLKIESRDSEYNVSIDSNCNTFNNNNVIRIRKSEHQLHYLKLHNYNFFENLRNKLMWGSDLRN